MAQLLRNHTLEEARKTGLPVVIFDEHNQKGETFGERFRNAFEEVFDAGFKYAIAIGNDTPELSHQRILNAQIHLESNSSEVVIGPAADGGTWLIGFSESAFSPNEFEQFSWKASTLLDDLLQFCEHDFSVSLLSVLRDVDSFSDLLGFLEKTLESESLKTLFCAISALLSHEKSNLHLLSECITFLVIAEVCTLRGPPQLK